MVESVKVRDLLSYPELEGARVVAGTSGLDGGMDDVVWFTGDTTAIARSLIVCAREYSVPAYKLDSLVRKAHGAGAAGLLILSDDRPPVLSTVRLADRLKFPVIQTLQADPAVVVPELITMVRAPQLVQASTVVMLTRQLSTKRTGAEILTTANSVLQTKLGLVTPDGSNILGEDLDLDKELRLDQAVTQTGRHTLIHPVLDPDDNRPAAWLIAPFGQAASARLDVLEIGLMVIEPFLRSWLSTQRAKTEKSRVLQAQLFSEIVSARDTISRDYVELATSLGWRLQDWHTGIFLCADDEVDQAQTTVDLLRTELANRGIVVTTSIHRSDGHVMWVTTETEPSADDGRAILRKLRQATLTLDRREKVIAGIGRPRKGPGGLSDTVHEARDASDLAASHSFRPATEHVDELGVARLLATWQRSEVTRAFAESALAPLTDSPHLIETLQAYLESGGSTTATASVLGIHRNTAAARIHQVESRLDADLNEPSQRLAFQVACRAIAI
ncbi:helix-turn-helix domain-containing protein [Brevibacterium sp. RIT 803]|uniref:helix-turn-helix domain-containing protein n=1 Tax=Brevibacterium sp. RIT 803 TaxID=2810210 RepID=UPI0019505D85|nr:helix-turn-helix domain-containing protein [Brevibacterium sp. RIT 803]MBM6588861.1 helix-turn-helix domain-containing protein [Brevibacterium sp. RIT 803]